MDYLLRQYIPQLCSRFRNYKRVSDDKWSFSCPICGDSKTNPYKARGGVYPYKNDYFYNCFRCGVSLPFTAFLKQQDSQLYDRYTLDKFGSRKTFVENEPIINDVAPTFKKSIIPDSWIDIKTLDDNHPAVVYLKSRKLPHLDRFYYCDDFQASVNEIIPDKFKNPIKEGRIIIPMIDKDGKLLKFQGRSLQPNAKLRYISIDLRSQNENFFWEKYIDRTKTVYVTEGALDALFVDNAIAVAGSGLDVVGDKYRDIVLVYDNEPRSIIIINKIEKAINDGFKVLIWSNNIQAKDINQMILDNESFDINQYVKTRTFSGISAKLELAKHRRC